jgi:peptidyl-prolyl cis-trans isomerase A (cyclophilin A)
VGILIVLNVYCRATFVFAGCPNLCENQDMTSTMTFHTNHGDININIFDNHAPKTVKNILGLADGSVEWTHPATGQKSNDPLYNGTIFHRIIPGFMIQAGDPLGQGTGGPGFKFEDEPHPELVFDRPYLLAMANAGPNTNGSQFFITVAPTTWLNFKHTIFGEVADQAGRDVVDAIANVPTGQMDRPVNDVVIESVTVSRG